MMFLVIFASLAAAMAIVAQGNLATADTHLKINRSLAAAETGMSFIAYRVDKVCATIKTIDGEITPTSAPAFWDKVRLALAASLSHEPHNVTEPRDVNRVLTVGPIAVAPGEPRFTATLQQHPIAGENYGSAYYQREPFRSMTPRVDGDHPLDATWVRVRVQAADTSATHPVGRAIQAEFKLAKKIHFAVLSRSRVMIGRNVMIEGPIGSRFEEVTLPNGHPVQMESDFRGLNTELDAQLDTLQNTLTTNDRDGDNRIRIADAQEAAGIDNPAQYDRDRNGYLDEFDFFLAHYDANADSQVSSSELGSGVRELELMKLIDTFGSSTRRGYNDSLISSLDRYAKVRGQVMMTASLDDWNGADGAAHGQYRDYFQGPIHSSYGQAPLTFGSTDPSLYEFGPGDFDVSSFRDMTGEDLVTQATPQAANHSDTDPTSPSALGEQVREEVPYRSAHPYDYYDRPVYANMTFTDVRIPKGTNAVFKNCTFIGCTFVESATDNADPNFNQAGVQEVDGSPRYPGKTATVDGASVPDTRTVANNIRFESCTFEGSVVTSSPASYTHVRNKVNFTGKTVFNIENSSHLTDEQKATFRRSTILAPQYSVEMGTFINPGDANETVKLSGTIVAGVLDIRGQATITGTVLTTFEPHSNTNPVIGATSPQFNTTLGYFSSTGGDLEAELPSGGLGVIQIRYDPTLPLPNGILGPIEMKMDRRTYFEVAAN